MLTNEVNFKPTKLNIGNKLVTALEGNMLCLENEKNNLLYKPLKFNKIETTKVKLIPYFAWDNRDFSEMKIWFPINFKL